MGSYEASSQKSGYWTLLAIIRQSRNFADKDTGTWSSGIMYMRAQSSGGAGIRTQICCLHCTRLPSSPPSKAPNYRTVREVQLGAGIAVQLTSWFSKLIRKLNGPPLPGWSRLLTSLQGFCVVGGGPGGEVRGLPSPWNGCTLTV